MLALAQFNTCLEGRSNRAKSLKGKLAALKSLGEETQAKEVEQLLSKFYQQSRLATL
ncbi:hypothetical protein QYS48_29775 [Marivirga arenosa]|jgi:hypothetical protein|uniref:Uncharacterized protein n=1 Tax=Marivirga arenosa TaxID=3059076 RepID=A0AA51N7U1_9BACT|nr:hypothetical protein [Marivirga sp. ABR2-2]WMN07749.1 hypothetical protein QYS48_29775 [Marivirga sp. ABR2-2]